MFEINVNSGIVSNLQEIGNSRNSVNVVIVSLLSALLARDYDMM